MSQVSPGWYPDPSGRFAQRYHDGARWTEHVADAQGNRATDVPGGQAGSASYAGSTQPYGEEDQTSDPYGQPSSGTGPGYGGQSAREQGWGQESPGSDRGHGRRPAREQGWGQEASDSNWGHGQQQGEQSWGQGSGPGGWPAAQTEGPAGGPDWRTAGQRPGAAQYDAGPAYGQPTTYGQPDYAYAPSASPRGFTPTVGLITAAVGAGLLLLSLFALDFLELSFPGLSQSVSLGDIAGDFGDGAPGALASYADFGRYLAVLVVVLAIVAVARLVPQLRDISTLPAIVAAICGGFALWHVLAMLASGEEGVDVSPTFGAILGLLGYVALAAAPFLKQAVGARR